MITRRLIRIKVFKVLYSSVYSASGSYEEAGKSLLLSCEKTLHLYSFILNLAVALKSVAAERIDKGLKKLAPTEEDLHPNRKFLENSLSRALEEDAGFKKFCEEHALLWNDDLRLFVKKLYSTLSERDYFKAYMAAEGSSREEDCRLFTRIFAEELEDNEDLESYLEDLSLYWMDDLGFVLNVILKNLDFFRVKGIMPPVRVFLKEDDEEYARRLLNAAYVNYDRYMDLIYAHVSNWDSERVVSTDLMLILLGIAEAAEFPNIPLKVTINEYVEISKFYSTVNSNSFVNGLLDRILQQMVKDGTVVKKGRGLVEN